MYFFETFQDMDVQTDPDLDDFSNMYKSNNNYGEFIVSLNKINGSLGFSLRSDPEDTTALRLVYSMVYYVKYGNTGCGVFKWGVQN